MRKGMLFVLTGPSGAGKGTVLTRVITTLSGLAYSVSVTTRKPRTGELDGIHYYFKTEKEFDEMQERGEFLESVCKFKHKYGTPKSKVKEQLEKGIDVILEIETKGATKIREEFPEAIFIFITPSSYDELARRLRNRGTEEEEMVKMRLKIARTEYRSIGQYDYIAINDDLDSCVDTVIAIIKAERARKINYEDLVKKLASLYRTHKNEE
ncbi:MAG: guanylate kinase [Christensenellales bacterium]|jgi:guanylate kinase